MSKRKKQITVVNGCVFKSHRVLMTQRYEKECPQAHLMWELPGGKVDFGETIEEALCREIKEETGAQVEVIKLLPITHTTYWKYNDYTQQTLLIYYLCRLIKENGPIPDHHVNKIAWQPLEKINNLKTLPGTKETISIAQEFLAIPLQP